MRRRAARIVAITAACLLSVAAGVAIVPLAAQEAAPARTLIPGKGRGPDYGTVRAVP